MEPPGFRHVTPVMPAISTTQQPTNAMLTPVATLLPAAKHALISTIWMEESVTYAKQMQILAENAKPLIPQPALNARMVTPWFQATALLAMYKAALNALHLLENAKNVLMAII